LQTSLLANSCDTSNLNMSKLLYISNVDYPVKTGSYWKSSASAGEYVVVSVITDIIRALSAPHMENGFPIFGPCTIKNRTYRIYMYH
jgi:hypothetical protein